MNSDRVQISPIWLTSAIGIGVALALAAAYPRGSVQARHLASLPPSELSVAYLEAWLRVSPDSPQYLDLLATQYLGLGKWDAAQHIAQKLETLGDDDMHRRALLLEVAAAEQQTYETQPDDPRREALAANYAALLAKTMQQTWDVPVMRSLAKKSEAAGASSVALFYYRRLAATDTADASGWNEKLGDAAFAARSYTDAANAYFAAQDAAVSLPEKRHYFILALHVLESGNQVGKACDEGAQHAGALAGDPQTLRYLIDLARQAGRTDLMTRYARALAKLASLDGGARYAMFVPSQRGETVQAQGAPVYLDGYEGMQRLRRLGDARFYRVAATVTDESGAAVTSSDYDLAFKAFLESNQLDDAERLAQQALARHFDPLVWTRRLAQVAQWNNHPAVALKYWKEFAQSSGNEEAWRNVLSLAPQLNDDQAYVSALLHEADQTPGDLNLKDKVVDAYERLGQPDLAMAYLKAHAIGVLRRPLLERYALVAERRGDDDEALRTYGILQTENGRNAKYALHIASLEYHRGRLIDALTVLREVRDKTGNRPEDALYWRTYGELARLTQHDEDANFAYQRLLATGQASAPDFNDMSYFYQGYPIDAARTAEMAFRKDGTQTSLQAALHFYTIAQAWPRVKALLSSLTPEQTAMFDRSSGLLAELAEYYRQIHRWDTSVNYLRRAAGLPDASDDTKVSYLWALIDFGNDDELRSAIQHWRATALVNSTYWGVFGAAELRLDNPAAALIYLRDQAALSHEDPLWMLSFAEAEEAAGNVDVAWRIRRMAWRKLQAKGPVDKSVVAVRASRRSAAPQAMRALPAAEDGTSEARVAMSETFANGDESRALLIALLERDRHNSASVAVGQSLLGNPASLRLPIDKTLAGRQDDKVLGLDAKAKAQDNLISAAAKDVALAWAVSGEHHELARAWLAKEYTNGLLRPADAEVTLALAENDGEALARVLDRRQGYVPIESRIDALDRLGRTSEAETAAFEAGQGAPDNDALHQSIADTLLRDRPSVGGDVIGVRSSPLNYIQSSLTGGVALTNGIDVIVDALQRNQRTVDTSTLAWVPAHDRVFDTTLRDSNIDRDLSVTVGQRDELNSFYTLNVHGDFNRNGALTTSITAGLNQFTDISPQMQVASTKDMLLLGAQWNTNGHVFAQGSIEGDRFHAQDRTYLGQGLNIAAELGYRIRTDYPDWNVRLTGERGIYSGGTDLVPSLSRLLPAGIPATGASFLPQNVTQYGFLTGLGTSYEDSYTRAWRPYLDVGLVHDSNQGWGPQINVGVAGTIAGNDHARIYYLHQAVPGSAASVTQIGISYRLYY